MLLHVSTRVLALLIITSLALPLAEIATDSAQAKVKQAKLKTVTKTFSNTAIVSIPGTGDEGVANPYPSTIQVSGLKQGRILDVNVLLNNYFHAFTDDVDMLLAASQIPGANAIIMSDVGDGNPGAVNINLVLDDGAPNQLPDESPLVSGTFQPTNFGAGDTFPAPAPTPSGNSLLSVFNNQNPNGTWQLFVFDDAGGDVGDLAGGWALQITAQVKEKKKHHHKKHH